MLTKHVGTADPRHPITVAVEVITPDIAEHYLQQSAGNRPIRESRLQAYVRDRKAGKWRLTHQGICFGQDGKLYDGHHRLAMIVRTGMATAMVVVRGIDPGSAINFDCGLVRGTKDALHMSGKGEYTSTMVAAARSLDRFPILVKPRLSRTHGEVWTILSTHHVAISFAASTRPTWGKLTKGSVAAIARAFYHVDFQRLEEFIQVLVSGNAVSENPADDSAAIMLIRALQGLVGQGGANTETERYCRMQAAIAAFCERRPIQANRQVKRDLYPLPETVPVTSEDSV